MKILKPGKVEQRKFTCERCGCVFVASTADIRTECGYDGVYCPEHECSYFIEITRGEPYEEPAKDEVVRLYDLICSGCVAKPDVAFAIKTDIAFQIARSLLENGVTFREVYT